jgi:hypothetical protein
VAVSLFFGMSACGPEAEEPVDIVERCGASEPLRLLPLGPREVVHGHKGSVAQYENRWLIGVHEYESDVRDVFEAQALPDEALDYAEVGSRIVSVDECGEDAFVVAEQLAKIYPPIAAAEPWLACGDDGSLYRFDPEGRLPLQFLLVAPSCWFVRTGRSSIVTFTDEAALVRVDVLDEGPNVAMLESDISGWRPDNEVGTMGSIRAERSLVSNERHELVEVEHATGERTILRTGAAGFESPLPGRHVAWTPDEIEEGESWPFPRRWFLWDRETDVEIAVADGAQVHAELGSDALMIYGPLGADDWFSTTELLLLPEMRAVLLEGAWIVDARLSDGTLFLQRMSEGGGFFVLRADAEAPTRLTDDSAEFGWIAGDGEYRRLVDRTAPGDDVWPPSGNETQDIVAHRAPDFAASIVVHDVYAPLALPGDRWLTVRDHGGDYHGELVVVDGPTGEVRLVDRDVFMDLGYTPSPLSSSLAPPVHEGPIVYAVRDEGFERAGLWIAELAP